MKNHNSRSPLLLLVLVTYLWGTIESYRPSAGAGSYIIDNTITGREFHGIGAISGGGATSKLLMNYEEGIRNQILDYLFKPNFGASLHILKVEIGGDSQSTDGSEASHMHSKNDLNVHRGYEWFMMKEAKKRNPAIKLYGLPWVFPGWLGGGSFNPFSNRTALVEYIVNWVRGAKTDHALDIDYVGIWNERAYDTTYMKMLRMGLDKAGFSATQIVVADGGWGIVNDILQDKTLLKAVAAVGVHYPGSQSPENAKALGIPIWSSEEYSAYNDLSGGGCWARILTESYTNGYLSAVIAWNLLTSYYDNLPYTKASLMVANQPWSGHYEVNSPIWASAHHTQFTAPGWSYLEHGLGVGNLTMNGSYVSLVSPDRQHFAMVVETLSPKTSHCFYSMPQYTIADQEATFTLKGSLAKIQQLRAFYSYLDFNNANNTVLFQEVAPIKVNNGTLKLKLPVNTVYTLTTLPPGVGQRGSFAAPPQPADFPATYSDDFEGYNVSAEAYNLAQQAGSFEIIEMSPLDGHGKVLMQMVTQPPVDTCLPKRMFRPIIVFGNYKWADVSVQYDFMLEGCASCASGVFLAARVTAGGCNAMYSNGIYVWVSHTNQTIVISGNHTRSIVYAEVKAEVGLNTWYTLSLHVKGSVVEASLGEGTVVRTTIPHMPSPNGFIGMGTEEFGAAYFDNLKVTSSVVAEKPVLLNLQKEFKGMHNF